jgi:hypothetical protein
MRRTLLSVLMLLSITALAQRIENIKAEVLSDGERVVITYDITGANSGQKFKISLYGSHDNYANPLSMVNGDVGRDREIAAGNGKRIEWYAKNELREFSGDITFEVRAEMSASIYIETPSVGAKFKKGKTLDINWKGGTSSESVRLELLKGGAVVAQIASISNNQRYSWTIPTSIEKGKDYQVRLTADSGTSLSGDFGISSKMPLYVKLIPLVVVGGVAAILLTRPDPEKDLPAPPEPN